MLFIWLIYRAFRFGLSNIELADSLVILWILFTFAFKKSCKKQTNMKRIFGLLMLLFSLQAFAGATSVNTSEEDDINVSLDKGSSDNTDKHPRTLIPITCVYTDGKVLLTLMEDVGEFTLTVTNQQTGEDWSVINTLVLPTSTANGIYWVEIKTGDGSRYWGTYTL